MSTAAAAVRAFIEFENPAPAILCCLAETSSPGNRKTCPTRTARRQSVEPHASSPRLPGHLSAINPAELVRRAFDPAMMDAAARLAQAARAERAKLVRAWRAERAKLAGKVRDAPTALRPYSNRPLAIGF